MNSKVTVGIILVGVVCMFALALSACAPSTDRASAPTNITPDSGCSIAETGRQPGQTLAPERTVVKSLTLTCGGESADIGGDFTNRTTNDYSSGTSLRSAIVVNGEARIWHSLKSGDRECLTIQRLDEALPSRDTCEAPQSEEPADAGPVEA